MKHLVSLSGGKDSTAMLIRMLELGYQVDDIVFVDVRFNSKRGGELPEMYEYLDKIENYIGRKITRIRSEWTFEDHFFRVYQHGKRKGNIYGFPFVLGAWCNDRLKLKPIEDYKKQYGKDYTFYVGIAADEPKRLAKMTENERSLLAEWGWTEQDCLDYLESKGLANPLYKKFKRTGCWFCPKQRLDSLRIIRKDYPDLWAELLRLDKYSPVSFKPKYTVQQLDEKFEREEQKDVNEVV